MRRSNTVRKKVAAGALGAGLLATGVYGEARFNSPEIVAVSFFDRLGISTPDCVAGEKPYAEATNDAEAVRALMAEQLRLPSRDTILWQFDKLLQIADQEGFTLHDPRETLAHIHAASTLSEVMKVSSDYLLQFDRQIFVPNDKEAFSLDTEATPADIETMALEDLKKYLTDLVYSYSLLPAELLQNSEVKRIGLIEKLGSFAGRIYPYRDTIFITIGDGIGATAIHEESHGIHFNICGVTGAHNDKELEYFESPFSSDYISEYAAKETVEDFAETSWHILLADTLVMGLDEEFYSELLHAKFITILARYNERVPGYSRYWRVLHEVGLAR